MAKKTAKVNPICGDRLQELIEKKGESNKGIAEKFGYTPEHISQILHHRKNLTPSFAEALSKEYPDFPVEYLLGLTEYRSESQRMSQLLRSSLKAESLLSAGLSAFASLSGYEITPPKLTATITTEEGLSMPLTAENCDDLSKATLTMIAGYVISNKDGQSAELSPEEMERFESECCDFVSLKLQHLLQAKGGNGNG